MTKNTRNILRLVSVIIVIALVLMEFQVIPDLFNYEFWVLLVAYAILLYTIRK